METTKIELTLDDIDILNDALEEYLESMPSSLTQLIKQVKDLDAKIYSLRKDVI